MLPLIVTLACRVREKTVEGIRTLNNHVVRNTSVTACILIVLVEAGMPRETSFPSLPWNAEKVSFANTTVNVKDAIAIKSATVRRTDEVDIMSNSITVSLVSLFSMREMMTLHIKAKVHKASTKCIGFCNVLQTRNAINMLGQNVLKRVRDSGHPLTAWIATAMQTTESPRVARLRGNRIHQRGRGRRNTFFMKLMMGERLTDGLLAPPYFIEHV